MQTSQIYIRRAMVLLTAMLMSLGLFANKTMLIINSYNENEPWINDVTQPILLKMSTISNVHCKRFDFNNALITDSIEFQYAIDEMILGFKDEAPSYIVMIGNLAFNARHAIKRAWGDLPMLLVTPNKGYVPTDEYFGVSKSQGQRITPHNLELLRNDYNFTAIIIPEYYKQTADMMIGLMPDMENFVFMSDTIYSNRRIAVELQMYLREEYPNIKFSWLKADAKNAETFHNYLAEPFPRTGLLLSTWLYSKHAFTKWRTPSASDLQLVSTSHNPIFSLHESYIPFGSIGGVYPDTRLSQRREVEVIEAMLEGKSMRDIPFFFNEESYPCINYLKFQAYHLPEKSLPLGTVFYSKPLGFWEKYLWQSIVLFLIVVLIIGSLVTNNARQRRKLEALRRTSEFVNNMPIPYSKATVRYDINGNVSTISYTLKNEAFQRILDDNVEPDSPFLLFPERFITPKVEQLLKDGRPQMFGYRFARTDSYYDFILCRVGQKNKDKNAHTIDIFAIDNTRREKSGKMLGTATRLLDLTLDAAKLIPWQYIIDTNIIIYDYHAPMSGHPSLTLDFDEFVDKQIYPDDQEALRHLRDDFRMGRIRDFSVLLRKVDVEDPEGYTWSELEGTVATIDGDSTHRIVVGSSRDVTERERTQKAMAEALERANESDRMKSVFLASISHEIRTPLNAIVGFSNVIAHTDGRQERMEFCDIINKNNEQLLALIDDVLDLAKIESNTVEINYEQTDINEMMAQVEKSMAMKVPRGIRFSLVKGSRVCKAEIDDNRVRQILTNMISNSCKFTSAGAITFGYEILESGMLYFYVRDTGIGLSEENQKRVFDRFFKLNEFIPGTGLGLTICYDLVHKMGGEIGVESEGEGKGSKFWFTVPYVPVREDGEILGDSTDVFFKTRMPNLPLRHGRTRLKVLVAEDNESNYRLLEHLLHEHFDVVLANNGHEAIRAFLREEPDVVLMDISMPGMDGYNALKEIRKFSATIPIIAVTAYVYASDRAKILQFGFDGYVSKPVTQKAIIDAIGHALIH